MQDGDLVTAAAFGPASDVIAVATARMDVVLYDVALLRHSAWTRVNGSRLAESPRLRELQGTVAGISFSPNPKVGSPELLVTSILTFSSRQDRSRSRGPAWLGRHRLSM